MERGRAAKRSGWAAGLLVVLWGLGALASPKAPAPATEATIRITGVVALPETVARGAIGPLPKPGENLDQWGATAIANIVRVYQSQGYSYVRAWFNWRLEPGVLWFYIDEGRVRVTFVGVGSITASLLRLRLDLPDSIFQLQLLARSLEEEKERLDLSDVRYAVHELPGRSINIFGDVVPERVLEISVMRRELFGWALDISLSAAWGVVPQVAYSRRDLLLNDDRLWVRLGVAVPYRRYVFDTDPKIQWVHGLLEGSYRLPRFTFLGLQLAPRMDSTLAFSHYARSELFLSHFYLIRDVLVPNLVLFLPNLEATLGIGGDFAQVVFRQTRTATSGQAPVSPPSDINSARLLLRATGNLLLGTPWTRRDQRASMRLSVDVCFPLELRLTLSGQYVGVLGRHRLIVRGRGVELAGRVPFWDDVELAGDYQRTYFGDRYWVERAIQVEIAYHIRLWRDWFEAGIFHDLSVFEDPADQPNRLRVADSFGPSLHFLILDLYALGIYQGFGFAPGQFSQTLSFTLSRVF
jgi:hypothetical protein